MLISPIDLVGKSDSVIEKINTFLGDLKKKDEELDAEIEVIKASNPVEVQRSDPITLAFGDIY